MAEHDQFPFRRTVPPLHSQAWTTNYSYVNKARKCQVAVYITFFGIIDLPYLTSPGQYLSEVFVPLLHRTCNYWLGLTLSLGRNPVLSSQSDASFTQLEPMPVQKQEAGRVESIFMTGHKIHWQPFDSIYNVLHDWYRVNALRVRAIKRITRTACFV